MKLVIQRVAEALVEVDHKVVAKIQQGLVVLIGFHKNDTPLIAEKMLQKFFKLNYFENPQKEKLTIKEKQAEILLISQFTLFADCKKGKNPSWHYAAESKIAKNLYNLFCQKTKAEFPQKVQTGIFGAYMKVNLINDGPFTLILDSNELFTS